MKKMIILWAIVACLVSYVLWFGTRDRQGRERIKTRAIPVVIVVAIGAIAWVISNRRQAPSDNANSSVSFDDRNWYIRLADGRVYGPMATNALVKWAEQGRIVPGNEVSEDKVSWRPAENLPELGMKWLIVGPGIQLGPYNRVAAELFLRSEKAILGASLREK